jgi:hypothetical protein
MPLAHSKVEPNSEQIISMKQIKSPNQGQVLNQSSSSTWDGAIEVSM